MILQILNSGYQYVKNYYYGSSVTWDGNEYTLVNPLGIETYNSSNDISTHHYICTEIGTNICQKVAYVYYISSGVVYYIKMENGITSISQVLHNMLANNTNNSTIKNGIDSWYKHYLLENYDQYIEDTIYCNDRTIKQLGGWDDNGGMTNTTLQFNEVINSNNLKCTNVTDQFSTQNSNARLSYKVGLITNPEMNLMINSDLRKTNNNYFLLSPSEFTRGYNPIMRIINQYGGISTDSVGNAFGVRPVISLIPGIKYDDGDGSKEHPYIIKTN
jgi:hypothetical protein